MKPNQEDARHEEALANARQEIWTLRGAKLINQDGASPHTAWIRGFNDGFGAGVEFTRSPARPDVEEAIKHCEGLLSHLERSETNDKFDVFVLKRWITALRTLINAAKPEDDWIAVDGKLMRDAPSSGGDCPECGETLTEVPHLRTCIYSAKFPTKSGLYLFKIRSEESPRYVVFEWTEYFVQNWNHIDVLNYSHYRPITPPHTGEDK